MTRDIFPLAHQKCTISRPNLGHFCQLHQREASLIDAAIQYLQIALASGENAVIITRPSRQKQILDWLTAKGTALSGKPRRIFVYSTTDLLDEVMSGGLPDWERFQTMASTVLDEATHSKTNPVRLYGDAVSDLWQAGNYAGAIELEACWNNFRRSESYQFSVFCGYLIRALDPTSYNDSLAQLGAAHNFTIPAPEELELRCALDEASRQILRSPLKTLKFSAAEGNSRLPEVFRFGLWLQEHYSDVFDQLLQRANEIYEPGAKMVPQKMAQAERQ